MINAQAKAVKLQTLARMLTSINMLEVRVKYESGIIKSIYRDASSLFYNENIIQIMSLPNEKWVLLKAACAYASGYMLFNDRGVWKSLFKEDAVFVHIVKVLEDARVVMGVVNVFPGTLSWFKQLNEAILSAQFLQKSYIEKFLYALWVYSMTGAIVVQDKKLKDCIVKSMPFVQRARIELKTQDILKHAEQIYNIVKEKGLYDHIPFLSLYQLGTMIPHQKPNIRYDVWKSSQNLSNNEEYDRNLKSEKNKATASTVFDIENDENVGSNDIMSREEPLDMKIEDVSDINKSNGISRITYNADCVNCGGYTPIDMDNIKNVFVKDLHKNVKFKQEILDDNRYEYMETVKICTPVIRKMMRDMRVILEKRKNNLIKRRLTKGKLDSNALWKLVVPDLNLFYSEKEPSHELDLAVHLLIDCSGSMVLPGNRSGVRVPRIKMAKGTAVVLHEYCKKLDIKHQITGFSTDYPWNGTVIHYPVVNWGEKEGFKIASLKAKAANRDGYSIRIAVKDLCMQSEKQKLLIILSDGAPHCDSDSEYTEKNNGVYDTALAVREAERSGIDVIGIYFGNIEQASYARKIYNNFIFCTQIEDLPLMLAKVFKKILS